ncbi:hypothetical protein U2F10_09725 [Leptothoe sp. EHU-05/26/07-4]
MLIKYIYDGGRQVPVVTQTPVRNSPVTGDTLQERDWIAQT